jgi:hypothetical protein
LLQCSNLLTRQGWLTERALAQLLESLQPNEIVTDSKYAPFDLFNPSMVAIATCLGCGGAPQIPGLVQVSGTVNFKGQPVEGATVNFRPESGTRAASGRTDANGVFQLTTLNPGDGALPGNYKVSVSKIEDTDPDHQVTAEDFAKMVSGGGKAPAGPTRPGQKVKSVGLEYHVPQKYMDADKSGLTATVNASGKNDIPIELN